jgi:hypothetical protein
MFWKTPLLWLGLLAAAANAAPSSLAKRLDIEGQDEENTFFRADKYVSQEKSFIYADFYVHLVVAQRMLKQMAGLLRGLKAIDARTRTPISACGTTARKQRKAMETR